MSLPDLTNTVKLDHNVVLGIDLGTTFSAAGYVDASGQPVMLPNAAGSVLTPSAVFFDDDQVVVGEQALRLGVQKPSSFAECFKRDMGKPHYLRPVRGEMVPPEILSAFVLESIRNDAERLLGTVSQVVITVPAYFDEKRRRATKEAGRLAGFNVLDIINEPTAAAVAHGYRTKLFKTTDGTPRRIMIYDLGGGTFDVSILEFNGKIFRTLATDGDVLLGGRDFDERLGDLLAERFGAQHGLNIKADERGQQQLWNISQQAKHALSECERHTVRFPGSFPGGSSGDSSGGDQPASVDVTRTEFEECTAPLVERSLVTCSDVIEDSGLNWDAIDCILLVGGASRMPALSRQLERLTGRPAMLSDSPDESIARGAALYAAIRSNQSAIDPDTNFQVVNVNAHSLGISCIDPETGQPVNNILIPRNSPLPTSGKYQFITMKQGQKNARVEVLEGESENPRFCIPLGRCVVKLEPNLPMRTAVEVSCRYGINGTISVSARVPATRQSAEVQIKRDQTSELAPLSVWRAKLTTRQNLEAIELPPEEMSANLGDQPLEDLEDRREVIKRLDFLFQEIGKDSAGAALPEAVRPVQTALQQATQELGFVQRLLAEVERAFGGCPDRQERARLYRVRAQVANYLRHAQSLENHCYVSLGRECVDHEFWPPDSQPRLDEIRMLKRTLG